MYGLLTRLISRPLSDIYIYTVFKNSVQSNNLIFLVKMRSSNYTHICDAIEFTMKMGILALENLWTIDVTCITTFELFFLTVDAKMEKTKLTD